MCVSAWIEKVYEFSCYFLNIFVLFISFIFFSFILFPFFAEMSHGGYENAVPGQEQRGKRQRRCHVGLGGERIAVQLDGSRPCGRQDQTQPGRVGPVWLGLRK